MFSLSRGFSLLPVHFVLLLGGIVFLVVLANGYGSNDPSVLGHSSSEIEYSFTVNELDCTIGANSGNGRCDVQCPSPGEQIVSGSCVTNMGSNANTIGAIDEDDDGIAETWRCEYILPMGAGVCNNNFICEKWRGETPTNCPNDCTSPGDDTTLFARVTCLRMMSGFAPDEMGHSVDEVALRVNMYVEDCSLGTADGSCLAICANPTRERAVGGNCISDLAFAFTGYGVTDALGNMVAWECTDRTHDFGPVLRAQVNCLKVGGP